MKGSSLRFLMLIVNLSKGKFSCHLKLPVKESHIPCKIFLQRAQAVFYSYLKINNLYFGHSD